MRLGLFGGTFDPPHIGHLIVAQDMIDVLELDRLVFVPAGAPPHKADRVVSPAAARVAMLEAAIAGDERFAIDAMELDRSGPSYSVDTVAAFRDTHPRDDLFLIIGADQFQEFRTWREPDRLAAMARIAVMSREASTIPESELESFGALQVNVTRIDISSTDIRRRVKAGKSIRYLVPMAVETWLNANPIYDR